MSVDVQVSENGRSMPYTFRILILPAYLSSMDEGGAFPFGGQYKMHTLKKEKV